MSIIKETEEIVDRFKRVQIDNHVIMLSNLEAASAAYAHLDLLINNHNGNIVLQLNEVAD